MARGKGMILKNTAWNGTLRDSGKLVGLKVLGGDSWKIKELKEHN